MFHEMYFYGSVRSAGGRAGPTLRSKGRVVEPLSLQHHHLPGVTVIRVGGELDAATASSLEDRGRRVYRSGDQLVFDLTETTFIDCGGLRALIRAHHLVRPSGGLVRVAGLRPAVAKVVALADVRAVLLVHASVEQAIKVALMNRPGVLTGHQRRRRNRSSRQLNVPGAGLGEGSGRHGARSRRARSPRVPWVSSCRG
jgi:anti-sigma B factor antagonist